MKHRVVHTLQKYVLNPPSHVILIAQGMDSIFVRPKLVNDAIWKLTPKQRKKDGPQGCTYPLGGKDTKTQ